MIAATPSSNVAQLAEQRDQLEGWLRRLDELTPEVPAHVARRVRDDYHARLEAVLAALAEHAEELAREAQRLGEDLEEAEHRRATGVDALDETRLRFRVGEVSESSWEARQPELEAGVRAAEAEVEELRRELGRLSSLLALIDTNVKPAPLQAGEAAQALEIAEAAPPTLAPSEAAPLAYPGLLVSEPLAGSGTAGGAAAGGGEFAFLRVLDRALEEESGAGPVHVLTEAELEKRPKPGVKCPDCGYTNDTSAWYCGVCGVDLS